LKVFTFVLDAGNLDFQNERIRFFMFTFHSPIFNCYSKFRVMSLQFFWMMVYCILDMKDKL